MKAGPAASEVENNPQPQINLIAAYSLKLRFTHRLRRFGA